MADERFLTHFDVSGSGLTTERFKMRIASNNIANVSTTRTPEGGPYKRMAAIVESKKLHESEFDKGVSVTGVHIDQNQPRLVFNPSHPDANKDGYVAYPNVDLLEETVNLKQASLAYQANATVIQELKKSIELAIDLGR